MQKGQLLVTVVMWIILTPVQRPAKAIGNCSYKIRIIYFTYVIYVYILHFFPIVIKIISLLYFYLFQYTLILLIPKNCNNFQGSISKILRKMLNLRLPNSVNN